MDGPVCGGCMNRYCLCDKQYTPRDIAEQMIAGTVTRDTQFVPSTDLAALRSKYASAVRTLQLLAIETDVCMCSVFASDTLAQLGEPVEPTCEK